MTTLRDEIKVKLKNLYGLDIGNAPITYSGSRDAFLIYTVGHVVVMTASNSRNRKKHLASLLWADDIKQFQNTVCETVISNKGNLSEQLVFFHLLLTVTVYSFEKGRIITGSDIKPIQLINAGDMLGIIHQVSMEQTELGIRYKIPSLIVTLEASLYKNREQIEAPLYKSIEHVIRLIQLLGKSHETYGVCFGEFIMGNLLIDTNNIHIFDFDSCVYAPFLYDVACFVLSVVVEKYHPERDAKDLIENHILSFFRIGYGINKPVTEATFSRIDLFIRLRAVTLLLWIYDHRDYNLPEMKYMDMLIELVENEDVYPVLDRVRTRRFKELTT